MLKDAREYLEDLHSVLYERPMGLRTGLSKLDDVWCGLEPSDLVVIGARSSMGKSSFAVDMALHLLTEVPVGIFTLEMSRVLLQKRMIANLANVSFARMVRDQLLPVERDRVESAVWELQRREAHYIDDTSLMTPPQIEVVLAEMVNAGVRAVFIDHLHLMKLHYMPHSKSSEIGDIAKYLKGYAKQFDIPIIALAQCNRDADYREDHKPRSSDLYNSDEIFQVADKVGFLYRPRYYDRSRVADTGASGIESAYVCVAKNRNGTVGDIQCQWHPDTMSFKNLNVQIDGVF